ncbi:hypothetical protein J1605_007470 [Eschrichtius robustus]|uniref:Uncharacterized protein n=1 Tax=Eschrichtius robustus TaxID=9764 RepID=A0AB34GZM6_ESCRO|nr:hypothetical protein J1605_007470 [Eschrichtius robustus]
MRLGCGPGILVPQGCGAGILVPQGCGPGILVPQGCGAGILVPQGCGFRPQAAWAPAVPQEGDGCLPVRPCSTVENTMPRPNPRRKGPGREELAPDTRKQVFEFPSACFLGFSLSLSLHLCGAGTGTAVLCCSSGLLWALAEPEPLVQVWRGLPLDLSPSGSLLFPPRLAQYLSRVLLPQRRPAQDRPTVPPGQTDQGSQGAWPQPWATGTCLEVWPKIPCSACIRSREGRAWRTGPAFFLTKAPGPSLVNQPPCQTLCDHAAVVGFIDKEVEVQKGWQKNMGATGGASRLSEGCELLPPRLQPLPFPVLPQDSQLLLVCPAQHPGHSPVPNWPSPLGTLFLLPSQGRHHQRARRGQCQLRGPPWGMVVAKVPELIKCLWGTATPSLTSGAAQTGKSRHPAEDQ